MAWAETVLIAALLPFTRPISVERLVAWLPGCLVAGLARHIDFSHVMFILRGLIHKRNKYYDF